MLDTRTFSRSIPHRPLSSRPSLSLCFHVNVRLGKAMARRFHAFSITHRCNHALSLGFTCLPLPSIYTTMVPRWQGGRGPNQMMKETRVFSRMETTTSTVPRRCGSARRMEGCCEAHGWTWDGRGESVRGKGGRRRGPSWRRREVMEMETWR